MRRQSPADIEDDCSGSVIYLTFLHLIQLTPDLSPAMKPLDSQRVNQMKPALCGNRADVSWLLVLVASALATAQTSIGSQPASPAVTSSVQTSRSQDSAASLQQTAWEILTTAIHEKKSARRQEAILALATIGPESNAANLIEGALDDEDANVRQVAATALGEINSRKSIPALRKTLDDEDTRVRFAAAKSLWKMGDHSGRMVLAKVLGGESSPSQGVIKHGIQDADAKLHSPKELALTGINAASGAFLGPFSMGVTVAEEFMKDRSASARAVSASLLATDPDPVSVHQLHDALRDKNWQVRAAAAEALGHHSCRQVLPDLQGLLDDKDEVKYMAAAAILRVEANPPARNSECKLLQPTEAGQSTVRASANQPSH
jgi:HEAT repeat protein